MPYLYSIDDGRFRDTETGQFVSNFFVENKSAQSVQDSKDTTDIIADLFDEGVQSFEDTRDASWLAIKDEYIRQYLLGVGGRDRMTPADWGRIGGMLSEQKRYFNNMFEQLDNGDISPAEFKSRMRMYIHSSNEAYWRARGVEMNRLGYDEVRWNLGATENHCGVCPEWASMGWQPVCGDGGFPGDGCNYPGDGSTPCLTSCRCTLSYRNSQTGEEF